GSRAQGGATAARWPVATALSLPILSELAYRIDAADAGGGESVKRSAGELALEAQLASAGIHGWLTEFAFAKPRRWRFDFAFPAQRLAIEIDGAAWAGGRHNRGGGMQQDNEKINEAIARGWRVLRGTTEQAENGWLLDYVRRCL